MSGFFLDLDHFSRSKKRFFFSVTTQWLNACTWELASRNFLDGLSVTIKAFSQLCKAQNGNQEGPLLYRAAHFWMIQNEHKLPNKFVKHKMANKRVHYFRAAHLWLHFFQIVEKKTNEFIRKPQNRDLNLKFEFTLVEERSYACFKICFFLQIFFGVLWNKCHHVTLDQNKVF